MEQYHKIQSVFKRPAGSNAKHVLEGQYSLPEFGYLQDNMWLFTEKVDGTNIRVMLDEGVVKFGGKTDNAQLPAKLVEQLHILFPDPAELSKVFDTPTGVCLYGEGCGPGIQKGGGNYGSHQDFILFDIRVGRWWLARDAVVEIAQKLQLRVVPVRGCGTLFRMVDMVKSGFESWFGPFQAEGIVARPFYELFARNGARIITKCKCCDFPH
jgi:hypothetical protein